MIIYSLILSIRILAGMTKLSNLAHDPRYEDEGKRKAISDSFQIIKSEIEVRDSALYQQFEYNLRVSGHKLEGIAEFRHCFRTYVKHLRG